MLLSKAPEPGGTAASGKAPPVPVPVPVQVGPTSGGVPFSAHSRRLSTRPKAKKRAPPAGCSAARVTSPEAGPWLVTVGG